MPKWNGGVIGPANTPTSEVASGVWSLAEVEQYTGAGTWPVYLPSDPYFPYTTLLLHGDGTNGAQNNTFLDSSTNNFTITRNGNATQGTFSPFSQDDGKWGAYFDGSGDYLGIANNAAFDFGSGDLTIECWFYLTGNASLNNENARNATLFSAFTEIEGTTLTDDYSLSVVGNNAITGTAVTFGARDNGTNQTLTYTATITKNEWHHVAVTKTGSTASLFYDGVRVAQNASFTNNVDTGGYPIHVGALVFPGFLSYFPGYISNVRVLKGVALYSGATYTVPTSPLTAISGTSLLTCQSNRFVDNSANAFAITVNGNTSIQPFSPFAPSAAYSAAVNGGSGYFDGTGDYLRTNSASLGVSTQNFTAECWIYPTTSMDTNDCLMWLMNSDQTNSAGNTWALRAASSNNITAFVVYGSTLVSVSSTTPVNINQWNHVAICRSGTTLYLGVNGAIYSTSIGSVTLNNQQYLHIGGAVGNGTPQYFFTGYISGARYEINAALYTSAYTVPTAPTSPTGSTFCGEFTNAGILDNTGRNDLETVGNAQISTSVKKFGTGSLAFDGTGDYLLLRPSQQLIFEGDFTIEFWLYITLASSTYHSLIGNYNGNGTTNWQIEVQNTGVIRLYYNGSSSPIVSASGVITNETWQHIAAVRSGSTVALYVNGSQIGTASFSGALGNTTTNTLIASIPQTTTQEVVGYIDDLRITKGVARYTSNFTPQTSQWQDQ